MLTKSTTVVWQNVGINLKITPNEQKKVARLGGFLGLCQHFAKPL